MELFSIIERYDSYRLPDRFLNRAEKTGVVH